MTDPTPLRKTLREALCWPGDDECWEETLATLVEHRDDVLAALTAGMTVEEKAKALGMERVGWRSHPGDVREQRCSVPYCAALSVPVFAAVPEGDTP